jgi:hypothetical protein
MGHAVKNAMTLRNMLGEPVPELDLAADRK